MKLFSKLILGVALLSAATNVKADAVFAFDTFNDNAALGKVTDNTGAAAGSSFLGQIYGSTTSSDPSTFVALGSVGAFGSGGAGWIFLNDPINVTGVTPGTTLNYVLKAWNSSAGASFETASLNSSAILGVSTTASLTLVDSFNPAFYESSNGFSSFQLQLAAVPEPTTIALGVLGGLGMLARRRRNAV